MSSGSRSGWASACAALLVTVLLGGCELFYPQDYSCPSGDCPLEPWDGGGLIPDGGTPNVLDPGADLGDPDAGTALRVINWNILYFGHLSMGPDDEERQFRNVRAVLEALSADVFALQEVSSEERLAALIAQLPGYAGFTAIDPTVSNAGDFWAEQPRTAFLYRRDVVEVRSASIVDVSNREDFAYRPPLRVDVRVNKGGATLDAVILVIHFNAGVEDYDDRRDASAWLKSWLDATLANENVLVVGDFNDDIDESITIADGAALPSPFTGFLEDPANYTFVTQLLSDSGLGTTVRYDSTIDHQLASNELAARLEPGSVRRIQPSLWPVPVTAYSGTTSDHYPVEARYQLVAP